MSTIQLRASLALWRRRHAYRQRKLDIAHARNDSAAIKKWHRLLIQAGDRIRHREQQLAERTGRPPRIITAAQLGLRFQYVFGAKGHVINTAGHYTAGPRAAGAAELAAEMRRDHAFHAGKGWGGLSYEYLIADDGTLGLGNPTDRKSAAVALHNTGLISICCPATTGHEPTVAQQRTLRWLLAHAHTGTMPRAHRSLADLRRVALKGHREFPDQSTACPGGFQRLYDTRGAHR